MAETAAFEEKVEKPEAPRKSAGELKRKEAREVGKEEPREQLQKEVLPTIVEQIEHPAVLEERVIPEEREEIQPVIHRAIEKTEFHEIIQPIYEKEVKPPQVEEITLPSKTGQLIREDETEVYKQIDEFRDQFKSSVERTEPRKEVVEKPPIIVEKEKRRIIEEIQPVIHKETIEPHVIKEIQPIFERIVEKPKFVSEVRPPQERRTLEQGPIHPEQQG